MGYLSKNIFSICLLTIISLGILTAQDTERPLPPELKLASVEGSTGFTSLEWSPGGSPDVAGYVIYLFVNGEGDAFDTIYNPAAVSYTHTKNYAAIYSVEYVVAAIDFSDNVSPLSNSLNTIFIDGSLDTCSHQININWNKYKDYPLDVKGYTIEVSENGSPFEFLTFNSDNDTTYSYSDFETASNYCFRVSADLEDGVNAGSNNFCIETNIKKPPEWINADYSISSTDHTDLSFTFDPESEINHFRIEKSKDINGPYLELGEIIANDNNFTFSDSDTGDTVYYYRAAALNSCKAAVRYSNLTTGLRLKAEMHDDKIDISWPEYREYYGDLYHYKLYRLKGTESDLIASLPEGDTIFSDLLSNFSYYVRDDKICYSLRASESNNPYIISQESISETLCVELNAGVYVPNAFSPDKNGINDYFYPKLSFTPASYKLIICTKNGIRLFETNNYSDYWDGTSAGQKLRPDVYLWFLELTTPGGKLISKKGTISIIKN